MILRRRGVLTALFLLLLCAIPLQGTLSVLNTLTSTLENDLSFGQTGITVIEDYDEGQAWKSESAEERYAVDKEVRLTADGGASSVPVVARALLIPRVVDAAGQYVPSDLAPLPQTMSVGNLMDMGDFIFQLADDWQDNWFYRDGYFYYKKVLDPGETTLPLLTKVFTKKADAAIREKYAGKTILVDVLASVLQVGGSASKPGGVLEEEWGVRVTDVNVSPVSP